MKGPRARPLPVPPPPPREAIWGLVDESVTVARYFERFMWNEGRLDELTPQAFWDQVR